MDTYDSFNSLNNDFDTLSENINDLNNTLGLNGCINNAYDAGEINGLQGLNCITRQYQSLILLLIVLYFWTTQYNTNYLMNAGSQFMCTLSCLLDKLVDNAICNCSGNNPNNNAGTQGDNVSSRNHKHRHKRRKCYDDCCDDCCDDEC